MKPGKTGITRIVAAARYSWKGLRSTWQTEAAFRQEVVACLLLAPWIFFFELTGVERALLLSSLILVLIVELLNSSIEAVVDRIGTEHSELSGKAKDAGSAAVLLTILLATAIWILILI
ncbi:diacylglycerol kinase [Nitrincola sp. MINF-07-Sa-05]|uniref:diacylglycerol kinase n=1 Tax=Nitrincola salilacus TaxID=3400273 RepID=UPI0039180E75